MISCLPTIAKAGQQIREGELSAAELVEFCLERIDRHEPSIAAWELVDREGACGEAARLDRLAQQRRFVGPLHGIPIGIKDIVDVAGWPTKAGSPTREKHVATADATLVQRLREAGAIILGKTVTTEFACFDPARTRNPWNLHRTPGGSSSGSAAAVASQMCMAAIGTQTGGSIIRPASYCGVCGLKPTLGHVSLDGVVPVSEHLDHAGPIARSVHDAARLFFSLVTPDTLEAMWNCWTMGREDGPANTAASSLESLVFEYHHSVIPPIDLRPVTGYFADTAAVEVSVCFQAALSKIAESLQLPEEGRAFPPISEPLRIAPPLPLPVSFEQLHDRHRRIMAVDAAAYHRDVFAQRPHDFGPNISTLIRAGLAERADAYDDDVKHRSRFRDDMCELLGDNSVAIMPSTTTAAPTRETTGDPAFNSPWSYAGLPSITIPCGVDDEGLPCGIQIVGPANSEIRVLRSAWVCEQALDFQTPPLPNG